MVRIFTHTGLDLDAAASVWAVQKLVPGYEWAYVQFRHPGWDGAEMQGGDFAVDLKAGGQGIKGFVEPDGTTHSCFKFIVDKYGSEADREILQPLADFIDAQDAHGSAIRHMVPEVTNEAHTCLSGASVSAVLRAIQAMNPHRPQDVIKKMNEIFDGLFVNSKKRLEGIRDAQKAELLANGEVALLDTPRGSAKYHLFEQGVKVVVASHRNNVEVIRSSETDLRLDRPEFVRLIEDSGEEIGEGQNQWFAHASGFLLRRGCRRLPATSPTKVSPRDIALMAGNLLH